MVSPFRAHTHVPKELSKVPSQEFNAGLHRARQALLIGVAGQQQVGKEHVD